MDYRRRQPGAVHQETSDSSRVKMSVLIPVRNEAANIKECLDSVGWADQLVVVDSNSTDGTSGIAQANGAEVIQFSWNKRFPKKKNWALENVQWRNEWVLILDADERITPSLADEIQSELRNPKVDGYFLNRRFMFLGKWLKHCGYYPSWNLRLFKLSLGRYEHLHDGDAGSGDNEVHEHVVLNGSTAYLQNDMLHYAYPNIYTWMEKHNRYSNWEAQIETHGASERIQAIGSHLSGRRKIRTLSRNLPFRPTFRFLYSYILKRGFLDGYVGFTFCRMLAIYEFLIVEKARELRNTRNRS